MECAGVETQKENTQNVLPQSSSEEKIPSPPPQDTTKKPKKEDRTKNAEQFMKSLNSLTNLEEKLSLMGKKYLQVVEDNKRLHFYNKQCDKRYTLALKEKDHLQQEFNKSVLVKSKLENLCRELQKQNKAVKEESLLKIREEEERRKETQAKFQNTLTEITTLLQQNNDKNAKLRDDNISMSEKFKSIVQQYQLREQQVDKMAKQMSLESQLSEAKLQKANLEHQADRERLIAEMEDIKVTVAQYRARIIELQGTEATLKGQLAVYTDKYDEFQNALVKSNQVFGGFKEQMELMSKKIKKLEKESLSWKKRWETSQTALLDMCGERQTSEERAASTARQLQHMQSLCRTLQAERTVLLATLKDNDIERPPVPVAAPAPPPLAPTSNPASNTKVDAMVANCAQLRQSLAHLQSQLNVLTNNKNVNKEEPSKQEKNKKSKSKKSKAEKQAQNVEDAQKEPESDESTTTKESTNIDESSANKGSLVQRETVLNNDEGQTGIHDEYSEDKIDEETVENLIQAINLANINLCDLEFVNEENGDKFEINNETHCVEELKTEGVLPFNESKPEKVITDDEKKKATDENSPVENKDKSEINIDTYCIEDSKTGMVPLAKSKAGSVITDDNTKTTDGKSPVVETSPEVSYEVEVKPIEEGK